MTKGNILIVEDEALIALDLRRRLEDSGYDVIGTAASAAEALEALERESPDVVLMDIHLQGKVDGIEAARALKSKWDIPVVFLTAHSDEPTLQRAKVAEPHGYLLKPFKDRELKIAIDIALYKHRAEAEQRRLVAELQEALGHVKRLQGMLPICAECKSIRDDQGYWNAVEKYIQEHSEARFSHGICPACMQKLYPEYAAGVLGPELPKG
jgi:CheY-like chemotaxis protein